MNAITREAHARNIARARAAIVRDRKLSVTALREELEWAKDQAENGQVKDRPIWQQVVHDLERVLAHRGGSQETGSSPSILSLVGE